MNKTQPSKILYKYFSLKKKKHKDRIKALLLENEVYLSNPTKFNDPFDRPHLEMGKPSKLLEGQIIELAETAYLKRFGDSMPKSKELVRKKLHEQYSSSGIHQKFLENIWNNFCALCLTQKNDNLLMWSHYASSHSGICVGFEHRVLESDFELLFPIQYRTEYPLVGIADMGDADKQQSLFETKHTDWAYECEYRVVNLHPEKVVKFSSELISSIYLGCEIGEENQNFIIELLSKRNQRIDLFKASKDINHLKLNFDQISSC